MQPEKIGPHEIRSELGRGRKAMVHRGYDPRFEREAKIIAQLEHSAIVPVCDVGEADGQPDFYQRENCQIPYYANRRSRHICHLPSLAPGSLIEMMVECYSSSMIFLTSPGP